MYSLQPLQYTYLLWFCLGVGGIRGKRRRSNREEKKKSENMSPTPGWPYNSSLLRVHVFLRCCLVIGRLENMDLLRRNGFNVSNLHHGYDDPLTVAQ